MTRRIDDVTVWERRPDRPYSVEDASTIRHPNGSRIASMHTGFLAAATREVLAIYGFSTDLLPRSTAVVGTANFL